jgi:DNA-binding response OmpR family regulator
VGRHVLVVEDNCDQAELLVLNLKDLDCCVKHARDGRAGLELALSGRFDLMILDLVLPGLDGLEVCKRVRQHDGAVPILMVTCRSTDVDRVLGLELGADDYITKPFNSRELLARVKTAFRRTEFYRSGGQCERDVIRIGRIEINVGERGVLVGGQPVELTAREFDLLLHFAKHPARVFSRVQLLDLVWGYTHDGYEHTVNSHINRLRSKIETDPRNPEFIKTVWGVGYKFTG